MVALEARYGRLLQRYNAKGSRQVVGCIPYRLQSGKEVEVLLISPQRKGKGMMFPKGGWEKDESIEDAAMRETEEEAGVKGILGEKLDNIWLFKSNGNDVYHEGHMFPLNVVEELDSWPEKDIRQREWMSVSDAKRVCKQCWMKEALDLLVKRLTSAQKQGELCAIDV